MIEKTEHLNEETTVLSAEDFNEFLSATGEAQWKILLAHAEKNSKAMKEKENKVSERNNHREDRH